MVNHLRLQRADSFLQVAGNRGELLKRGFQVFDDFCCDDVGIGKVGAVFE